MSLIAVAGPSGVGKSTSMGQIPELNIKGLDPKETFIINIAGKPLPFKGWRKKYTTVAPGKDGLEGNYYALASNDRFGLAVGGREINPALETGKKLAAIFKYIKQAGFKNVVLDDWQYIMGFEFMRRAKEKGYDKFNMVASEGYASIQLSQILPEETKVFFMCHDERETNQETGETFRKIKTSGKLVDNAINVEGLMTVVLFAEVRVTTGTDGKTNRQYGFTTQSDGTTTAKSPVGMFDSDFIPNDLGYVVDKINEYEN